MKTTVDIPERELGGVMRYTKAATKTEAVARAVADFNRQQRLSKLAAELGNLRDMMTRRELDRMRAGS